MVYRVLLIRLLQENCFGTPASSPPLVYFRPEFVPAHHRAVRDLDGHPRAERGSAELSRTAGYSVGVVQRAEAPL